MTTSCIECCGYYTLFSYDEDEQDGIAKMAKSVIKKAIRSKSSETDSELDRQKQIDFSFSCQGQ